MSYDETPEDPTIEEELVFAICNNDRDMVLHLISVGADLDCHDWFGATMLQNATTPEMVHLLVGEGADPEQLDAKGRTARMTLPPELVVTMEAAIAESCADTLRSATPSVSLASARRF